MRALSSSLPLLSSAALLFARSRSFRSPLSSGVSASSRTLCSSRQLEAFQPRFAGYIEDSKFPPPSYSDGIISNGWLDLPPWFLHTSGRQVSSQRNHMMLVSRRGLEASVAGVALVLIVANFLSPGWTNTLRVHSTSSARRAVFRVHAMAGADVAPLIVVYVTVPNKETGTKLAHSIITNKLAACVNQIPGVESTYWWQGKVETDLEILLIIKTRQAFLDELTAHVKANHPYDTPEVIALPITGGSDKYLKWIEDSTEKVQVGQE